MRSLARWGTLLVCVAPIASWALTLGEIQGNSYLNQRLDAQIPLTATQQELDTLRVTLAPPDVFAAEGVDYVSALTSIQFEVGRTGSGEPVVLVTSTQLIRDPFLTFVVEASTGRTTTYRVMTVLLDPPTFLADDVTPEQIAPPATRDPEPAVAGGQITRPPAAPAPAPAPEPVIQPAAQASAASAAPAASIAGDYTVQGGDTLWALAERARPAGVTRNQAMISIFEANPDAFVGNINRLRRGAILRFPPDSQFGSISAADATAEVQRQNDAWQGGGVQAEPSLRLIPPSSSAETGAAPTAASAQVAELEDQVSDLTAELAAARADLAEAERLLELRDTELANVQNLVEAQAAAAEAAAALEAETAGEPAEETAVFVDEEGEADAPAEEEPATAAQASVSSVSSTQTSSPSLLDQVVSYLVNPIVLGIVAIVAIVLGGLAFLRRRREDDIDDVTGQWEALEAELTEAASESSQAAPSPATDFALPEDELGGRAHEEPVLGADFAATVAFDEPELDESAAGGTMQIPTPAFGEDDLADEDAARAMADQTISSQTVINLDRDDPIAEADFHMAYGLYDQAAELINKALEDDPDNLALKLKLLEVYFVWGNQESFLERAQALHGEIGQGANADWDKVVIMGKQICPDEALFSQATAAAGEVDLVFDAGSDSAGLDFAFDDSDGREVELDLEIEDDAEVAMQPSGAHEARVETPPDADTLDIGDQTQAGLEAAFLEDDDDDEDTLDPSKKAESTQQTRTLESEPEYEPTVQTPKLASEASGQFARGDTMEQPRVVDPDASAEFTAEIDLDDLGLDIGEIDELPGAADEADTVAAADDVDGVDFVVGEPAAEAAPRSAGDTLSATGITQVLDVGDDDDDDMPSYTSTAVLGNDDGTAELPDLDIEATGSSTEVLEHAASSYAPEAPETEDDLDLNLDDFSNALGGGADTVEQPVAGSFGSVDLDVGADVPDDEQVLGSDEYSPLDPQTMTEVGTKLDLARAYIDMGDPEGARSILEEVLTEGDATQRTEAQSLIDALPAA